VRLTSDGVPVLFHDDNLSERLIQKNGMVGPVENYTYGQLYDLVRLIRGGEHIPTLRQALETALYQTPIRFIWLDTKFHGNMQILRDLQAEYLQKAATIGRQLKIVIGIPDTEVQDRFVQLPGYQNIPSVCELDPSIAASLNSQIWAPRWTLGLQNDEVSAVHGQGRKAFVWTLDVPENINEYLNSGSFDGILSDYPSSVAYYYYVRQ
jgi:glycerophosphoryl diester phosphodiesterase